MPKQKRNRLEREQKMVLRLIVALLMLMVGIPAFASDDDEAVHLDEIVVIASKTPALSREIPYSVTAFDADAMADAGITLIGDAAAHVPNTYMVEFTERVLSQPYFRGIGSGPNNPAVTTYIDGVPQLHGYSANNELLDVSHIEFVRGAQGTLYGRNTVGGVIHILSGTPALSGWEYGVEGEYGGYSLFRGEFRLSGPLVEDELGLSLAAGYASRDGYSDNDVTGRDIDAREAFFSKLQLRWLPTDGWSARFILFAEQDRDGDYALADLAALRRTPHHVERDYEGFLDRDLFAPTLALEYTGGSVDFTSVSGFVRWETKGATDLDYTPMPFRTRESKIRNSQTTQEFQFRSAKGAPLVLSDTLELAWQAGALFFKQDYREISINKILTPILVDLTSPSARLEDKGFGAYLQATLTAREVWDISLGIRCDYESKEADLKTFSMPPIAPSTALITDRDFTEVSPQFSLTRRIGQGRMIYGTVHRGYRTGGFNPVSPPGSEAYDEETSWNYEIGAKTTWLDDRLLINLALFRIVWDDLQLNLPLEQNYYIANTGDAESTGAELEISAMPIRDWELFGSIGYNRARFGGGSSSIRTDAFGTNTVIDIGDNDLIYAPEYTAFAGTQYTWVLGPETHLVARAEVSGNGGYYYNTANTESQDSYWLTSARVRYKTAGWFAEIWTKNLFDTEYVPVAFEFPNGQSGLIGESGAPLTVGIRAGLAF